MTTNQEQTLMSGASPKRSRVWIMVGCGILFFGCLVSAIIAAVLLLGADFGSSQSSAVFEVGESGSIIELDGLKIDFGSEAFDAAVDVQVRVVLDAEQLTRDHELLQAGGFWFPVGPIYEVELPPGRMPGAWVEVTLPYEPDLLGGSDPQALSGAAWNGAWWERKSGTVDPETQTVTFLVDHFSKVAVVINQDDWRVETAARGRPAWQTHTSPSGRFQIQFTRDYEHAVLEGQGYQTPFDPSLPNPDQVPLFVRDLGYFLDEAADMIQPLGYTMPPRDDIVMVEVRNLNIGWSAESRSDDDTTPMRVDGATGSFGPIYIDSRLYNSSGPRPPDQVWSRLLVTAAHEFYHVVQRYNPSFPTWFYESSAAYLEWKLFEEIFPGMYSDTYGKPGKDFLVHSMWGGTMTEHYAKAAFLIYLDQQYGSLCQDLIVEGFHPSGGSSYGIYAANLKQPDLRQAFVSAAQRCGGFAGTWEDLLAEFAAGYYADREVWPGAGDVIGSEGRMRPERHDWSLDKDPGAAWSFKEHAWAYDSAQLWRIGSMQTAPTPRSTLVLRLAEAGTGGSPAYRAYPLRGDVQQDLVGPTTFSSETPTLAVENFGSLDQGAAVNQVYLVGVHTTLVEAYVVFGHTVQAYLLPQVHNLRAAYVEEGYGKGTVAVTWEIDETYVPDDVEFVVYTSQDAGWPLQNEVDRKNRVSRETNISFDPDVVSVSVVLEDAYGNQAPVVSTGLSSETQELEPLDYRAIMLAAQKSLGVELQPDPESCVSETGCWWVDYDSTFMYAGEMYHQSVFFGPKPTGDPPQASYEKDLEREHIAPHGPPVAGSYAGSDTWHYRADHLYLQISDSEWIPQGISESFFIYGPDWQIYHRWSLDCPYDNPQCVYEDLPTLMPFADALLAEIVAVRP